MTTTACVLKIASHTQMNDMDNLASRAHAKGYLATQGHPFRARGNMRQGDSNGQLDKHNSDEQEHAMKALQTVTIVRSKSLITRRVVS